MENQTGDPPRSLRLTGGVVAYNEERRIRRAVSSLLSQELPPGIEWETLWVVASGCTDRTVANARSLGGIVRVVEQAERLGKSAALLEVFRRAQGDLLVLLNGDAVAEPGSLRLMLNAARGVEGPFAVMARPTPASTVQSRTADGIRLLWKLHHRFYADAVARGTPSNLSDEYILLPVSHLPPLEADVVNDGGFIGSWLARSGRVLYEPRAVVSVTVPAGFPDYLRQRRRIRAGAYQLAVRWGSEPDTLSKSLAHHPRRALGLVRSATRSEPRGVEALSWILAAESASASLALLDAHRPAAELSRWSRIADRPMSPPNTPPTDVGSAPKGPRTGWER